LGEEIARGGMGVVCRATDTVLGREVAVKVLQEKYAANSGTVLRFVAEARITGQLQHPGIPAIHDLGILTDGRPFLAMKLIKGETLDQLLRRRGDTTGGRGGVVAVFEQVCQAVAYAHAHGVLHRDLKPANIMVGAFGEVQVMDWGLAKVLAPGQAAADEAAGDPLVTMPYTEVRPLWGDDLLTHSGSVLGTPAYMPPEQAIGAVDQIDARSDVFGLGGVLAAVLTGHPPFVGHSAENSRQLAARGKLHDCFSRLDGCGADPELVTLCKRCLSPEKADRPANAGEVAAAVAALRAAADERARQAELNRVRLEGEQAAAAARSLERRRRRRFLLGAAAALVVAALGGLTAVLAVQRQANHQLEAKNSELAEQKAQAEARFEMAQKAIATLHTGVSEDFLLKNPEFKELRTKLLKDAAGFYSDLEKVLAGKTDAKSRKLLADGYFQLGDLTAKIGDQNEALAVQRKALALRRELAAADETDVETRLDVARSLRALALLLRNAGDKAGALSAFQEQRDLAATLETGAPIDEVRSQLAYAHFGIGIVLEDMGKPSEGLKEHQKALAIRQKLLDANPAIPAFQSQLVGSHLNIGNLLRDTGQPAEALNEYQKALAIARQLADGNPAVARFQSDLAGSRLSIGYVLSQRGKSAEALNEYQATMAIFQKLADANPAVTAFQSSLAITHNLIGQLHAREKRFSEAFVSLERGLAILQKLADGNGTNTDFMHRLGNGHAYRGWTHVRAGHPAEAAADLRRALALWEKAKVSEVNARFERSRALALLAGLAADAKSGVTCAEAPTFADQAVAALGDAFLAGWGNVAELKEPDFDSLRDRKDFKKLVADLEAKMAAEKK
jgi:tetratricopeptide (TPR) repeat protein